MGSRRRRTSPYRPGGRPLAPWIVMVLLVLGGLSCGGSGLLSPSDQAGPGAPPAVVVEPQARGEPNPRAGDSGDARSSGMRTVAETDLPPEARATIALIHEGGPFPYRQDGSIFGNRERLLPIQPQGYYREYTVETPGESDRGARRIVAGREGELYYTDDHYASFVYVE